MVELLVVLGIVAVLISLLLTVINKTRQSANMAKCQSNLRAAGAATIAYTLDHEGVLPCDYRGIVQSYYSWGGKAGTEYPDIRRQVNPYVGRGGGTSFGATFREDGSGVELFHCPSDDGTQRGPVWNYPRKPTVWDCLGSSYGYNSGANLNYANGLYSRRLSQISTPVKCIMACDWSFLAYAQDGNPFQLAYWHSAENGWGNVLFIDGHVAFYRAFRNKPDWQNGPDWTFAYDGK